MVHVIGGVYLERCPLAGYEQVMGSGGRGAATLARLGRSVVLVTAGTEQSIEAAQDLGEVYGFNLQSQPTSHAFTFTYPHLAGEPRLAPLHSGGRLTLSRIETPLAVAYGMLEAEPDVRADLLVYDPQAPGRAQYHTDLRIDASQIAYVLNLSEGRSLTGLRDPIEIGPAVQRTSGASIVVLKCGAAGGWVFDQAADPLWYSAYRTDHVWPIGSGDVFTATFAHAWFGGSSAFDSADFASRATALHSDQRRLGTEAEIKELELSPAPPVSKNASLYLAAPFFTAAQISIVEELRRTLQNEGLRVFSPYHDVGIGKAESIAEKDLAGLRNATAVLALLDGHDAGTLFEVGYARALGKPVVVLAENFPETDLLMFSGSGCTVARDTATAVYHAIWAANG